MSKVSIIIPAYNQARFLEQAVRSALQQTHPDVQVIVIDDGSTDDTPQVTARFATEPQVRVVRQTNAGLPGARNRGLRESSGEYVCFLDADDFYEPEKVATQVRLLEADPALAFVYCDITTVDEEGAPRPEQYSVNSPTRQMSGNIFSALMLGGYFPPHTVMIRRSVLDDVGDFDPDLGGHADYDLWLRVAGAGYRACYQDQKLACYRISAGSMSKDGQHMAESRLKTLQKISRQFPELTADGLQRLQQVNHDLYQANQWLQQHWVEALAAAPASGAEGTSHENRFSFIKKFAQAKLVRGNADQSAVWRATLDGSHSEALYLQPPAELVFELPIGSTGKLTTAVAIHPDAWNQPTAGACEFRLRINGQVAFALVLDPAHIPPHRHWFEIALPVPEIAGKAHRVTFETAALGGSAEFRWALWREPQFIWQHSPTESTEDALREQRMTTAPAPLTDSRRASTRNRSPFANLPT